MYIVYIYTYYRLIAERMRLVENPADLLGNPHRLLLNETLVRSVLESLTPNNSLVFLGTHHVNFSRDLDLDLPHDGPPEQDSASSVTYPWPDLNEIEPFYSTPFAIVNTPSELVDYWGGEGTIDDLSLPKKNEFIPRNFTILPPPATPSAVPIRVDLTSGVSCFFSPQLTPLSLSLSLTLSPSLPFVLSFYSPSLVLLYCSLNST